MVVQWLVVHSTRFSVLFLSLVYCLCKDLHVLQVYTRLQDTLGGLSTGITPRCVNEGVNECVNECVSRCVHGALQ